MIIIPSSAPHAPLKKQTSFFSPRPVSSYHLSTTFQQMGTMAQANIPMLEILKTLSLHASHTKLKDIFNDAYTRMQKGHTLYDSFLPHEKSLSTTTLSMFNLADASGEVAQTFHTLSHIMLHDHIQHQKLFKALHTPLLTLIAMVIAMITLITFVVPQFETMFFSKGATLPLMTTLLIAVAHFFTQWGIITLLASMSAIVVFQSWCRHAPSLALKRDTFFLELPVFGTLITLSWLSHFTTILSSLIQSGLSFNKALPISIQGITNHAIHHKLSMILTSLEKGEKLTTSFEKTHLFDPISLSFIAAAENSGSFDALLTPLCVYITHTFDHTTHTIIKWIEPFLVLCMGGMVLVLALGIFMPMWSFGNVLH